MRLVISMAFACFSVFLAGTAAAGPNCVQTGNDWECTGGAAFDLYDIGVRTDVEPDATYLCWTDGTTSTEVKLYDSTTLGGDVTVNGGGGQDLFRVVYTGSTFICGHSYYNVNEGTHWIAINGGDAGDTIEGGNVNSKIDGDAGNDRIWNHADDYITYGGTGNDLMISEYIYAGEYLYGEADCDCLQDMGGPSGPRANFSCGTEFDNNVPVDFGTVVGCEDDEFMDDCEDDFNFSCPPG